MPDRRPQTKENHTRFHPPFHFFFLPAIVVLFALSFKGLIDHPSVDSAAHLLLILVVGVVGFLSRMNALKVQDRVIRLEERLRLSALLPSHQLPAIDELSERQLVALRFASDEEVPMLALKAHAEHLDPKAIKASIQQWRPDYWRV